MKRKLTKIEKAEPTQAKDEGREITAETEKEKT